MDYQELRRDYQSRELRRTDLKENPFEQFQLWYSEALQAKILEPNAMALATVSPQGKPACRTVLMKDFNERGIVFYTNSHSRKGQHLASTPYAEVVFLWKEIERQILVEGKVEMTERQEVERYFATRPRGSQLSAWASPQSQPISSRKALEEAYLKFEERFKDQEIPLPPFWSGYCLVPYRFEFWQGRKDRLHDRFSYYLEGDTWLITRLGP